MLAVSALATFFVSTTARIYDLPLVLIAVLVICGKRIPRLGALLFAILLSVPYAQMFFMNWRENIPLHVWFFWIPALLAAVWVAVSVRAAPRSLDAASAAC